MRQGQQNRRGRGRSNNNSNNTNRGGKGHNPLTRTVESNGPDVKIRGNPSHIAEKYITLARDSLSSGDIVMAENYLQHAEHYNRIIMAHREQLQSQQENNSNRQNIRPHNNNANYNNGESQSSNDDQLVEPGSVPVRGNEPQPHLNEQRSREPRENTRSRRNTENRAERPPRTARPRRNSDSENGEQPHNSPSSARRRNANGSNSDGPKITDGQEAPGFLRTPVAPAAKRGRRSSATETQRNENTKTADTDIEKDDA